jgi:hypothetical protein
MAHRRLTTTWLESDRGDWWTVQFVSTVPHRPLELHDHRQQATWPSQRMSSRQRLQPSCWWGADHESVPRVCQGWRADQSECRERSESAKWLSQPRSAAHFQPSRAGRRQRRPERLGSRATVSRRLLARRRHLDLTGADCGTFQRARAR